MDLRELNVSFEKQLHRRLVAFNQLFDVPFSHTTNSPLNVPQEYREIKKHIHGNIMGGEYGE